MKELKISLLKAQTVNQLVALIIENTHEEIMQVYQKLTPDQQAKIEKIWNFTY